MSSGRALAQVEGAVCDNGTLRADLFIFPELNITGGFWSEGEREYGGLAERVPGGECCSYVEALARRHHTTICCGIIEAGEGRLYATHFLCGPDGFMGKQRKLHTHPPKTDGVFASGGRLTPIRALGCRCVILACADVLLPEASVLTGLAKAALIICPTDCFDLAQKDVVIRLVGARCMDARACAAMAFGNDGTRPTGEGILAGLAMAPSGEVLAMEVVRGGETKILKVDLPLREPDPKWGGVAARSKMLLDNLNRLCG